MHIARLLFAASLFCLACSFPADASLDPAPKGVVIDASFTGAWYDPSHAGEGFLLEILDDNTALAYWFTYNSEGEQLWVVATGVVNGNRIDFTDGLAPRGARFGANFDPTDVDLGDPWGDWSMVFDSCDSASLEYTSRLGDGTQSLIRLTAIEGIGCSQAKVFNGSMTGAWFDERRVGEGFLIDVVGEATAVVYWFTYDNEGNPFWITATGSVVQNRIVAENSFYTRGGIFGPSFDPSQVELIDFGPLAFAFDGSGDAGAVTFAGPVDFGNGEMSLRRLTSLQSTPVTFNSPTFSINAGTFAANNTAVDGDPNDPNITASSNDASPQRIPNPVRVAGFASAVGSGIPGSRFENTPDQRDLYLIELGAGQAMILDVSDHDAANPAAIDLDLALRDTSGEIIAASQSLTAREEVVATTGGTFIVDILAFAGASSYTLSTGNPGQAATAKLDPLADMVTNEAIIRLSDGGKANYAKRLAAKGLTVKAGVPEAELLVDLSAAKLSFDLHDRLKLVLNGTSTDRMDAWETILAIKSLAADPDIELAEPNYLYQTQLVPSDPAFETQWHYPLINLPQAWDITTGSPEVIVAVIDSGVARHPDNAANVNFNIGFDSIANPLTALDRDGVDFDATDPGDQANPNGSGSYHGTHVAGTIAADTNNGSDLAGVAWDVTIMPIRSLGRGGSGSGFDILQGFRWAARQQNSSGALPPRAANVINMSLGGPGSTQVMQDAITEARQAGIYVVAAAGNSNTDRSFFPAAYDGVISVAASTIVDGKAPYSNFGPTIDITAPGGNTSTDRNQDGFGDGVLSLLIDDSMRPAQPNLTFYQGTSMAAPHMAGVIALMKSVHPAMSPPGLDQAIARGDITVDLGEDGAAQRNDTFGFGRIDAEAAVGWAFERAGGTRSNPVLKTSINSIALDSMTDSAPLFVDNVGAGQLTISEILTNQPWLGLSAVSVNANGVGEYQIDIDREGLPTGQFQGALTFRSNGGTIAVAVAMDVGDVTQPGDFGTVYILAVDPLTRATLAESRISAAGEEAIFSPLLPGEYLIAGGTDLDNDGFVCDPGELCGALPTLNEATIIELIDADLDAGDLTVTAHSLFSSAGTTQARGDRGYRRLR